MPARGCVDKEAINVGYGIGTGRPPPIQRGGNRRRYAYLLDPDGGVQRVPHEDPAVRAVHERIRTWGGRAPSPALTEGFGIYDAQFLAGLDRDLVDAIENLPEDRLRSLTRWCAHRAFEHAGLAQFPDFRTALTALDDVESATAPTDFVNASQARWRLDTDPDIPVTIVSGLPGSSEQIQQHQAIATTSPPRSSATRSKPLSTPCVLRRRPTAWTIANCSLPSEPNSSPSRSHDSGTIPCQGTVRLWDTTTGHLTGSSPPLLTAVTTRTLRNAW
ncbi:hypothetical protein NONI108955_25530 [Nocardia ninae]